MSGPQYKIKSGEPTRKLVYQRNVGAPTGIGTGVGLAAVLGYYISRFDPNMPEVIVTIAASLLAGGITAVAMYVVGWVTRPAREDVPIVDPATTGERIEPMPGIPPED